MLVVSTVGTSILGNVETKWLDRVPEKYRGLVKGSSRLSVTDERQREFEARAHPGDELFDAVYRVLEASPREASAELNALLGFLERRKGSLAGADVELMFYSTDTGTGYFCARLVERYARERLRGALGGARVQVQEPVKLKKFGWGYEYFHEALLDMVDKAARLMANKKRSGYRVYVNATAGFKVEAAYLTLVSLLVGADSVFYVHEATRDVIELPVLPLGLKAKYADALRELREPTPRGALERRGVSVEELEEKGLVEVRDGLVVAREWVRKLLELVE
ncbi:putative CRISPR-associated protein, APE2256 family [Thermofilum pendens Hrk 5]|uniref:CRISPR-associated protein, APE2256 family n=1 Tax=Thermofilum pendens (strain DSM 2475 / Hrk 5) TaxID=368408 RepID=A1RZV9_THEPD|nr:putative CRISPR-associated protein, APE2256 family [Thermofilum pendens Hrk 5]